MGFPVSINGKINIDMNNAELSFPEGFLWGASTAAHQVEGNNTNSDWWAWERSEKRLAQLAAEGKDPSEYQSGDACDHFRRYREDIALMQKMHLGAYRFSLEWARIEPEEGSFDLEALMHYAEMIEALKSAGIEPIVTLHHQTNPQWFTQKYGWQSRHAPRLFVRYAEQVAKTLGRSATWWLTMNEPKLLMVRSGPTKTLNPVTLYRAMRHLTVAHNAAYDALRAVNEEAKISLAYNFQAWSANDFYSVDEAIVRIARKFDHEWFLDRIRDKLDFMGVNYYTAYHFSFQRGWKQRGSGIISDMGWEVFPEGLYHIVHELHDTHQLPILITENGIADANDTRRAYFIVEHLKSLYRAIQKGDQILGYCHWSLMDNFEWEHGFGPRFGLLGINYETQERTMRPSAKLYAEIAKRNAVPLNL